MSAVDWFAKDWGNRVHVADNGSHVLDQLHEDDGGDS